MVIDIEVERQALSIWQQTGERPKGISPNMFLGSSECSLALIFDSGCLYPTKQQLESIGLSVAFFNEVIECTAGFDGGGSIVKMFIKNYKRSQEIELCQARLNRLKDFIDPVDDLIPAGVDLQIYHGESLANAYNRDLPLGIGNMHFGLLYNQLRMVIAGDVVTIAGRSGTGKTAFALHLMEGAWRYSKKKSLFFSIEMTMGGICQRMHDIEFYRSADMPFNEILQSQCSDSWFDFVKDRSRFIEFAPNWLYAYDKGFHVNQLKEMINETKKQHGQIDIIAVDYLQLLSGDGKDRRNEVSDIARKLKQIAKETGTIILSLSQTSRANEDGSSPVKLHHLKESGDIEEASDIILGLWKGNDDSHIFVQDIKNRKGGMHNAVPLFKCGVYFRHLRPDEYQPSYEEKKQFTKG